MNDKTKELKEYFKTKFDFDVENVIRLEDEKRDKEEKNLWRQFNRMIGIMQRDNIDEMSFHYENNEVDSITTIKNQKEKTSKIYTKNSFAYPIIKKLYFIRLRTLQRHIINHLKKVYDYFVSQTDYSIQIQIYIPKPYEKYSINNQSYYRIYFSTDNTNWKYIDVLKYLDVAEAFSEWKTKLCFSPKEIMDCPYPTPEDTDILFNKLYPDEFVWNFIYSDKAVIPI